MTPLRFAVIGNPVSHSKSPAMMAAAFSALDLPHTYEALPTLTEELPVVVRALRTGAFAGLNVTVPHKTNVLAWVDRVHDSARRAGASNTLARDADGCVVAHNTDVPALAAELEALAGGASRRALRALVLGSGGAARAAVVALDGLGVREVVVRARTARAAFELRPGFPLRQAFGADPETERRTDIVVQATSAGMTGADPGDAVASVVAWGALPSGAVALDVVYAPAVTPFLEAASRRGLQCVNGLGMLARQGALALELWLGQKTPLQVMGTMRATLESGAGSSRGRA